MASSYRKAWLCGPSTSSGAESSKSAISVGRGVTEPVGFRDAGGLESANSMCEDVAKIHPRQPYSAGFESSAVSFSVLALHLARPRAVLISSGRY